MKAFLALLTTVGLSVGSVAVAANGTYSGFIAGGGYPGALKSGKVRALLILRDEGLKLQRADGGQLTPEHYTYLQTKLDGIQTKWR